MAGPVSITCPMCREAFPVPTEVVGVDAHAGTVLVTMDRSELYGHLRECAGEHGEAAQREARDQAKAEHPAGQASDQASDTELRESVPTAPGTRPCTMCATSAPECMQGLANSTPCCGACGEGNTHPSKHESVPCAQWAAEHLSRKG